MKNMLDFLKNYQLSFLLPFLLHQVISEKFGQNKLSSLFLDNSLTVILVTFVMPWSFLVLFEWAKKCFIRERFKKYQHIIESIGYFIKYNLIFLLFQNTTQEMSLFFDMSFSSDVEIISGILCVFYFYLQCINDILVV